MYIYDKRIRPLRITGPQWAFVVMLVLFIVYLFSYLLTPNITLTPEENIRTHYQKLSYEANSLTLSYREPLNQQYDTTLVKPRNVVINDKGDIVPSDFVGIYLVLQPLTKLIGPQLANAFIFSALSALGVMSVYLLTAHFFKHRAALLAMILVGAFPIYFYWAERIMTDIPSLAFCFLGMYYFVRQRTEFVARYAVLAGLFMGVGISIKYTNAILIALFCLTFLPYRQLLRSWAVVGRYVLVAAGGLVAMLPILLLNARLYGGILKTGQQAYSGSSTIIRTSADISLIGNIFKYFISFAGIVTVLSAIGCLLIIKYGSVRQIKFLCFVFVYTLVNIFFFGKANDVFGAQAPAVLLSHSQPRYFLGAFILIIVIAGGGMHLFRHASPRLTHFGALLVFILAPGYFLGAFNYNGSGFVAVRKEANASIRLRDNVLAETPKDGIVFTQLNDKLIFPDRKVVSYYNAGLDSLAIRTKNTATLADKMVADNRPVYWLNESVNSSTARERGYGSLSDYEAALSARHLALQPLDQYLYKVVRSPQR